MAERKQKMLLFGSGNLWITTPFELQVIFHLFSSNLFIKYFTFTMKAAIIIFIFAIVPFCLSSNCYDLFCDDICTEGKSKGKETPCLWNHPDGTTICSSCLFCKEMISCSKTEYYFCADPNLICPQIITCATDPSTNQTYVWPNACIPNGWIAYVGSECCKSNIFIN